MLIRRALALSSLALATALAAENISSPLLTAHDAAHPPPAASSQEPTDNIAIKAQIVTLRDAIAMALRNNLDIQWQKADISLQDDVTRGAWGDFDPQLQFSSTYTYSDTPENPTIISSADTAQQILLQQEAIALIEASAAPTPVPLPSTNVSTSAAPVPTPAVSYVPYIFQNKDLVTSANISEKLPIGTTLKLGIQEEYLNDTVLGLPNQTFLPSNVFFAGISIDQPLLQGLGFDANMVSIRIGRRNRQINYNNWRQRVIDSVAQVMTAYFDMSYAQQLMAVRQKSTDADQALADANQRRVNVGLMTPIDVRQAEVGVSSDQYDFLTAQSFLTARVADLKKLVLRGVEDDDGRTFLTAGPVEMPLPRLDREQLLADAFQNRVDYATAIQQTEIEDIRLKYYRNQLLPRIDLIGTLGINGLSSGSTRAGINEAFDGQGAQYVVGIQGTIPFGDVAGRANLAASHKLREEAIWKLKQVELAIHTDVDTAISAIQSNQQRVASARATSRFAQQVVDMENRRIEAGQASTIDILDNRRRLYDAQSSEIEAVNDLNKSIVQLYLATGTLLTEESIQLADDDPQAPKQHHPAH
jgi:outer membrane protein TolC